MMIGVRLLTNNLSKKHFVGVFLGTPVNRRKENSACSSVYAGEGAGRFHAYEFEQVFIFWCVISREAGVGSSRRMLMLQTAR